MALRIYDKNPKCIHCIARQIICRSTRADTHVTIYLFANKKKINWRALRVYVFTRWHSIINIWLHVEIVTPVYAKYRCHFATNATFLFSRSLHKFSLPIRIDIWNAIGTHIDGWNLFPWIYRRDGKRCHGAARIPSLDMLGFCMRTPAWGCQCHDLRLIANLDNKINCDIFEFECVVCLFVFLFRLHKLAILFYFSSLNCLSIVWRSIKVTRCDNIHHAPASTWQ